MFKDFRGQDESLACECGGEVYYQRWISASSENHCMVCAKCGERGPMANYKELAAKLCHIEMLKRRNIKCIRCHVCHSNDIRNVPITCEGDHGKRPSNQVQCKSCGAQSAIEQFKEDSIASHNNNKLGWKYDPEKATNDTE